MKLGLNIKGNEMKRREEPEQATDSLTLMREERVKEEKRERKGKMEH